MKNRRKATNHEAHEESLTTRVVSSVVGVAILGFIMWVGLPLVIPALVFLLWLGSAELRDMLAKRGIELNMAFLRWGGLLMLVFSYPPLSSQYPGIPWREIALGLVLIGAFSYELLNGANIPRFAYSLMAFLYLPWMLGYFLLLRYHPHDDTLGIWTLTLPLLATFATDIGAYFIGRFFGRNKLAPTISPGKTVEGSIGGIASSFVVLLIYTSIVRHFYPESAFALLQPLELFVFSLLLSLAAQLGDLTESMLKRYCGVKDSGSFLPGHGGLLDRMDSVLFSVPLAYYLLVIFYPI